MIDLVVSVAGTADAGELFTLQRAAYVSEAQLYGDVALPALTQTCDELRAELASGIALKAVLGHRIVGAVRARVQDAVLHIGRLAVAPDLQGHGIGSTLLAAVERAGPATSTGTPSSPGIAVSPTSVCTSGTATSRPAGSRCGPAWSWSTWRSRPDPPPPPGT